MKVEWSWHRFWYGCVGAAAPEIVRLLKAYKEQQASVFPASDWSLGLILVSVAFVGLGGVFASAWGDDYPIKCIYNGATFPLLLSAWFSSAPPNLPK
jgi:hypothetical protein